MFGPQSLLETHLMTLTCLFTTDKLQSTIPFVVWQQLLLS
jgi:hypothetical protein